LARVIKFLLIRGNNNGKKIYDSPRGETKKNGGKIFG
jgi:hypothetical protein